MDILEIYRKHKGKNRQYKTPKDVAKKRLEHMLIADKMQISAELAQRMEEEIYHVVKKYINPENSGLNIKIDFNGEIIEGVKNDKTIQIKGL